MSLCEPMLNKKPLTARIFRVASAIVFALLIGPCSDFHCRVALAQQSDPFQRQVDVLHAVNSPANKILAQLGAQSGVEVLCAPEAATTAVTIDCSGVTVDQAIAEVLDQSHLAAVTNGHKLFVVPQPLDKMSPEDTALHMPINPDKPASVDLIPLMQRAQDAYLARDFAQSEKDLRDALELSYQVEGQQGFVFEIVQRFQQMFQKQGLGPAAGVAKLDGDPYLSTLLLRFYRRQSVQNENFDAFCAAAMLLNKVAGDVYATQTPTDPITELEQTILGETHPKENSDERLARMEQDVFGHRADPKKHDEQKRISCLQAAVLPGTGPMKSASNSGKSGNWFTNPPPIPWLNSLGHGAKTAAKGIVRGPVAAFEGADKVLSSPLFWEATLGAAAVTGAYFATRSMNNNASNPEHACTGNNHCTACSSCLYCANCQSPFTRRCQHYFLSRGLPVP
jgi:hypothetical protein